jgi:hypothetical protein
METRDSGEGTWCHCTAAPSHCGFLVCGKQDLGEGGESQGTVLVVFDGVWLRNHVSGIQGYRLLH